MTRQTPDASRRVETFSHPPRSRRAASNRRGAQQNSGDPTGRAILKVTMT